MESFEEVNRNEENKQKNNVFAHGISAGRQHAGRMLGEQGRKQFPIRLRHSIRISSGIPDANGHCTHLLGSIT